MKIETPDFLISGQIDKDELKKNFICVGQNKYRRNGADDIYILEVDDKLYTITLMT